MSGHGPTGHSTDNGRYYTIAQIEHKSEPGEILEFEQRGFTHHALYLGEGRVMSIDFKNEKATKAQVTERSLYEICDSGRFRLSNHKDIAKRYFQASSRPSKQIVEVASCYQGRKVPFEFEFRNSEYYCTLWRYGKGFSTMAEKEPNKPANFTPGESYTKYVQLAMNEQGAY